MQTSTSSEAILEWLQKEMGYRPLGHYVASNKAASQPSIDSIRKVCRGNMIPVWNFLVKRVKSDKTVENLRRNILVFHDGGGGGGAGADSLKGGEAGRRGRGRRKESLTESSVESSREIALQERDLAKKEAERSRHIVRRQRKELKVRMSEVSREEAERKRMLDERHKQVMLEAYDQQCDEAAKIFAEYHKRLHYSVNQARDAQMLTVDSSIEVVNTYSANSEKEAVYSTVKGTKSADEVILVETTRERNIRKACESLTMQMIEKIRSSFPAYEGSGIHLNPQLEAAKAITAYTQRMKTLITREIEKIDVRADAETLRYKYENNRVMDASPDASSPLQYQLYGNGKIGMDVPSTGTQNQLLERQATRKASEFKAHVQQFVATEDALNKAAEARNMCQKLLQRLHRGGDAIFSQSLLVGSTSQNVGSLRQFEVWAKEREAAGLRASLNTLMFEVPRLNKLCAERKEAEDSLIKKWKKIEEFDGRRSELESIYNALLKANMDAAVFWSQQPLAARAYASSTIIPACTVVVELSNGAKDFIDNEVSSFYRSPDNSLYMLPSTPQDLKQLLPAEKNAVLLTARAGARDPSSIPSICRISAALQYPAGLESSDAGLASVLESLEFCLKHRGSEACVLEDLAKAINLVHIRQDLVESGTGIRWVLADEAPHRHPVQIESGKSNYHEPIVVEQQSVQPGTTRAFPIEVSSEHVPLSPMYTPRSPGQATDSADEDPEEDFDWLINTACALVSSKGISTNS
ncbi:hypothetical protein HYC85_005708 [Camellia sinensis]|uniref:Uncharacterized protein n=1 Tax=Camellia sinensis TaxID=4442 RepID=A0A7J7I087_CAMSI|nr:hypothetical protein HYC85_005708 [Camellia sinensis]